MEIMHTPVYVPNISHVPVVSPTPCHAQMDSTTIQPKTIVITQQMLIAQLVGILKLVYSTSISKLNYQFFILVS